MQHLLLIPLAQYSIQNSIKLAWALFQKEFELANKLRGEPEVKLIRQRKDTFLICGCRWYQKHTRNWYISNSIFI